MPERESLKQIPKFESEDEEREFWATHDSTDYVDWSKAHRVIFPDLKPSTRTAERVEQELRPQRP